MRFAFHVLMDLRTRDLLGVYGPGARRAGIKRRHKAKRQHLHVKLRKLTQPLLATLVGTGEKGGWLPLP
jgi:hypothetical protein